MRRSLSIPMLSIVLLAAALLAGGGGAAPASEPEPEAAPAPSAQDTAGAQAPTADVSQAPSEPSAPAAPAGAVGLTIYKDPVTGRLMPVPPDKLRELLAVDLRRATSTSHEGLVETAAPGGGVMIDLRGRFQDAMEAEVGPDGKVTTRCGQDHHEDDHQEERP